MFLEKDINQPSGTINKYLKKIFIIKIRIIFYLIKLH